MKEENIRDVSRRFNLFSDDGIQGVTCIVSDDGHYEIISSTSSTMGKAESLSAARRRCGEIAADHFKTSLLRLHLARLRDAADAVNELLGK